MTFCHKKYNVEKLRHRAGPAALLFALAAVFCLSGCPSEPKEENPPVLPPPPAKYSVSGTVSIRNGDGDLTGAAGAEVRLTQAGAGIGAAVTTGSDGAYTVTDVTGGDGYALTVTLAEYKPLTLDLGTVSRNVTGKNGTLRPRENVYIAGYIGNDLGKDAAILWKNGIPYPCSGTDIRAFAFAVTDAGDIWFGGTGYASGYKARYWKNDDGEPVDLSAENKGSFVYAVAAGGTDVHFAGYDRAIGTTTQVAVYWKNGTEGRVALTATAAAARGIALAGDDVYVVGYSGGTSETTAASRAVYWKNGGEAVKLSPNGTKNSAAMGAAVSGADIYIAGFEIGPTVTKTAAKYWKLPLSGETAPAAAFVEFNDGANTAQANAIAIAGDTIYAVGFENFGNSEKNRAVCWINGGDYHPETGGKTIKLTNGSVDAQAYSLAVTGNTLYIAGKDKVGSTDRAVFWKVDMASEPYTVTAVPLSDGAKTASAQAVVIVTK